MTTVTGSARGAPGRHAAGAPGGSHPPPTQGERLGHELGSFQFFALAFGAVVGAGWAVVLGDWLRQAGPVGAAIGLSAGGAVVILIGLCYGEVATLLPVSGGEVAYAYEVFGERTCFLVGWLLAFTYVAVAAFEAISIGWVLAALVPGLDGPTVYRILGGDVHAGALALGLGGMALLTFLNYRGARAATRLQDWLVIAVLALAGLFIVSGFVRGHASNLVPYFQRSATGSIWPGMVGLFMTASFWFGGFNVGTQAMEEKTAGATLHRVGTAIVLSIVVGIVFKALVIISASMSMPWPALTRATVPVAAAFEAAFGSALLAKVVLVTALFGLLSTWNSVLLASTRILYALGRAGFIASRFGTVHPRHRVPAFAIVFAGAAGALGTLLGRTAIIPIVDAAATCLTIAYLLTCLALIRLRTRVPDAPRPFRAPGGRVTAWVASAGAAGSFILSLYEPWTGAGGGVPLEWRLLGAWLGLGLVFWVAARAHRRRIPEALRRQIILGEG